MIRYHGTPITPVAAAAAVLKRRHALISFADPRQIALSAEVCQSFVLDNGAFTAWRQGKKIDHVKLLLWLEKWSRHPGCDWLLIPDVIDGELEENKHWIREYQQKFSVEKIVPVFHLHEPLSYLAELVETFSRVALGSSGEFKTIKSLAWEQRMNEIFSYLTDSDGVPLLKIHGLRMMNPTVFSRYPFSSVDSANVARNMGIDKQWVKHPFLSVASPVTRAIVMADRCEDHAAATVWKENRETQYELILG